MALTQKELKSVLSYDCNSGVFTYKKTKNNYPKKGMLAGSIQTVGSVSYIRIKILGNRSIMAHRLAWLYVYGAFPINEIDHRDGNGLNNRIDNLRDVSRVENCRNFKRSSANTSGYCGVHFAKRDEKWVAQVGVSGKRKWLGAFNTKEEAIEARKEAEIKYQFSETHGKR